MATGAKSESKAKMLAYYGGVIVQAVSDKMEWTKERADGWLCMQFLVVMPGTKWAYILSKKTLDREEWATFLDKCKIACRVLGIDVDDPTV